MIEVRGLGVRVGPFALHDVNLTVSPAEYHVLLGPTGVGKSVLLQTIAGIRRPTSGVIRIGGRDVTHLPPEARDVGFVPQDYALFPHRTVEENISFGLRMRRQRPAVIRACVEALAAKMGLESLLGRHVESLSGGERQRVALCRALAIAPTVLLLDEPTNAVDPSRRRLLWAELKRLQRETGVTTLHITHLFDEALAVADRLSVFLDGRVRQEGTADEVFSRPARRDVAEFLAVANLFEATVERAGNGVAHLRWNGMLLEVASAPDLPTGTRVSWCIRPGDVMILRPDRPVGHPVRENQVEGRIVGQLPGETVRTLWVEIAPPGETRPSAPPTRLEIHIPNHAFLRLGPVIGGTVRLSLKRSGIRILLDEEKT
jgi:ABC-type Fe3+/spermidine/putrescine transport system ATPase subunit